MAKGKEPAKGGKKASGPPAVETPPRADVGQKLDTVLDLLAVLHDDVDALKNRMCEIGGDSNPMMKDEYWAAEVFAKMIPDHVRDNDATGKESGMWVGNAVLAYQKTVYAPAVAGEIAPPKIADTNEPTPTPAVEQAEPGNTDGGVA